MSYNRSIVTITLLKHVSILPHVDRPLQQDAPNELIIDYYEPTEVLR